MARTAPRLDVALGNDEERRSNGSQEEKKEKQCSNEMDHREIALKALLHYLETDDIPSS